MAGVPPEVKGTPADNVEPLIRFGSAQQKRQSNTVFGTRTGLVCQAVPL